MLLRDILSCRCDLHHALHREEIWYIFCSYLGCRVFLQCVFPTASKRYCEDEKEGVVYEGKTITVVVPTYNEEKMISQVLNTMPDFVDLIIVVDDASTDRTTEIVTSYCQRPLSRTMLIQHQHNQGVGATIITGYKAALAQDMDAVAVMAGDGQMDPDDLPRLVEPVIRGKADYAKGNRLFRGESWQMMPHYRYLGNSLLSLLTKIASGYWHVADSQTGYTVISRTVLQRLPLERIYKRYGMPNDMLIELNVANFRVRDVSIRPVYNIGEVSGIRLRKVIPTISWLLLRGFCRRLIEKYIIRDFHPLIFFYAMGLTLLPAGVLFGSYLLLYRLMIGTVATTSALFATFLTVSGLQSLFFAMWFDMDYNKHLK
jgi:glycosyltransferase involved in cell wall biosynthesis